MLGEIYWDEFPANVTRVVRADDEISILFEGKISEFKRVQSGRIVLKRTTDFQDMKGTVAYKDESGNFNLDYNLSGAVEDDSYELFSGNWVEEGGNYKFDILLEPEEKALDISQQDEQITESAEEIPTKELLEIAPSEIEQNLKYTERFGANRKRATRSDARVRTVQRSIELYCGLSEGSVRLVNPDRSIIHPSAKIRTLREHWSFDE